MQIYQFLNLARVINKNENINKIILVNLLDKDLAWLYANLKTSAYDQWLEKYLALVKQYASGKPLAYIFGYVFFYGKKILVDENVLIPRAETEILVAKTLLYAQKYFGAQSLDVLDLCTGSGCIAVSLASKKANWNLIASDISSKALATAQLNQKLHQVTNLKLIASDLFINLHQKFDVIVCNPPYIDQKSASYQVDNLVYEPSLALFASQKGLHYYHRIFALILNYTKKDFFLAFEIAFDHKQSLEKMLQKHFSSYFYWFEKDYCGHWRFLFISSKEL